MRTKTKKSNLKSVTQQQKKYSIALTHQKTNMTIENTTLWRCISYLKEWWLSIFGVSLLEGRIVEWWRDDEI